MKYEVQMSPLARKSLLKVDSRYLKKIMDRIDFLEIDPRHHGCKKLKGEDSYRSRVGKYRILYKIFDHKVLVVVLDVDHRKDIYR